MEKHFELTDEQFEQQFHDSLLALDLFTHEAHVRLAWIHVKKYGVEQALQNITTQLRAYVETLGATDKYNETLTVAAVKAVYHFYLRTEKGSFQEFILKNRRLKENFRELMNAHYATDIFRSPAAKKHFLAPELLPFD
ncbi:hypothetical protein [Runella aurantiaca]|uniref:Uncharacterized protein n=1 Tax=Runella aurantiaca TaxID=2282308 RepID=A0A369I6H5_9BACT|nr:hypothetical protein [Runella aurantiaca]RDB02764.1 hypothetical protein DVG78_26990 [Runella aurantiaca]